MGEVCTLALCQPSSQWPLLTSGLLLCGGTSTWTLAASWGADHLACLKWGYTLRVKAAWLQEERLQQTKVWTLTDFCVSREELTLHLLSQLPLLKVGQLWLFHHHYGTWKEQWRTFFTTVVSHKHRNEAFIHLLLIFERLGVQNTGNWPFSSFWVSALKETFCVENSPPEPCASGCFLSEADMAFWFLTYFRTSSPTCSVYWLLCSSTVANT